MLIALLWGFCSPKCFGQQTPTPSPAPSPTPKKESEAKKLEKDFEEILRIKHRRPSVSNPADFNTPGVLQVEYGYGGYFRGNGFRSQQAGTLTISYAATERIGFEFDFDTVSSQRDLQLFRTTGVGDSRLGVQLDIADETNRLPSFAVSYFAKLPTASVRKDLGTGRVDHAFSLLFSKKVGKLDVDFNSGLLIIGKQGEKGSVTGGQVAFGVSRDLTEKVNFQAEIFGETKDADEPQGFFSGGIFTYQLSKKASFNAGLKFGLTPASPRFGLTFGIAYQISNRKLPVNVTGLK
ncbi:MAG: transporter [Acidobacteriota bacterium]|nr:MAG: transporter [Acidobacteriota bacterium]